MDKVKIFIKQNLLTLIGVVVGIIAGYLYWRLVGCESGTCPITASPVNMGLWGGVFGGLLFSMFKTDRKKNPEK